MVHIDGERKRQGRLRLRIAHGDTCVFGVDVHIHMSYDQTEISPIEHTRLAHSTLQLSVN